MQHSQSATDPCSYFLQQGHRFTLTDDQQVKVHTSLPPGVYEVELHPMMGFYLAPRRPRPLPPKLYGSVEARGRRILRSFRERLALGKPTGALLAGEKGSGKTLLANFLMRESGLPAVVVSQPFVDPLFLQLLVAGGPKLVLFDEFEKVYHEKDAQAALLSMLDGHHLTQNLTVATINDPYALHDALKNRPSRFYYHYRYGSLERAFIEEYCADKLLTPTPEGIADIHSVAQKVSGFNFDMLQSLVEEVNRFGDSPSEAMKHINIVPSQNGFDYEVKVCLQDGTELPLAHSVVRLDTLDPLAMEFSLTVGGAARKLFPNGTPLGFYDGSPMGSGGQPSTQPLGLHIDGGGDFTCTANGTHIFEKGGVQVLLKSKFKNLNWAI